MAVKTNRLQTILSISGAAQYTAAMQQAAAATQLLATAQSNLAVTQALTGGGAAAGAGGGAGGGGGGKRGKRGGGIFGDFRIFAALYAVRLLDRALEKTTEREEGLRRLAIQMRNVGESANVERVVKFSQGLTAATGTAEKDIEGVISTLLRFGISSDQAMKLAEPILNTAAGSGHDLERVAVAFGKANLGIGRALKNEGIMIQQGVRGQRALAAAVAQADEKFRGLARGQLDSVGGQLHLLQAELDRATSSWVQLFGPALKLGLGVLADSAQGWALLAERLASSFGIAAPQSLKNLAKGNVESLSDLNKEETQKKIADELSVLNDQLIQKVLGGPGNVARGAATLRDQRIAFGA